MNASTSAWWEAVTSEFVYEQGQLQKMNNKYDQQQQYDEMLCKIQPPRGFQYVNEAEQYNMAYGLTDHSIYPDTQTYAPCQGPRESWNFAYCYGYYGEPACPMANLIDMEDFM